VWPARTMISKKLQPCEQSLFACLAEITSILLVSEITAAGESACPAPRCGTGLMCLIAHSGASNVQCMAIQSSCALCISHDSPNMMFTPSIRVGNTYAFA